MEVIDLLKEGAAMLNTLDADQKAAEDRIRRAELEMEAIVARRKELAEFLGQPLDGIDIERLKAAVQPAMSILRQPNTSTNAPLITPDNERDDVLSASAITETPVAQSHTQSHRSSDVSIPNLKPIQNPRKKPVNRGPASNIPATAENPVPNPTNSLSFQTPVASQQLSAFAMPSSLPTTTTESVLATPDQPALDVNHLHGYLNKCPAICPDGAGRWVELRCPICGTNSDWYRSTFLKGSSGMHRHMFNTHKYPRNDQAGALQKSIYRVVPIQEVRQLSSGQSTIEMVRVQPKGKEAPRESESKTESKPKAAKVSKNDSPATRADSGLSMPFPTELEPAMVTATANGTRPKRAAAGRVISYAAENDSEAPTLAVGGGDASLNASLKQVLKNLKKMKKKEPHKFGSPRDVKRLPLPGSKGPPYFLQPSAWWERENARLEAMTPEERAVETTSRLEKLAGMSAEARKERDAFWASEMEKPSEMRIHWARDQYDPEKLMRDFRRWRKESEGAHWDGGLYNANPRPKK